MLGHLGRYETKLTNSAIGRCAERGSSTDDLAWSASASTFEGGFVFVDDRVGGELGCGLGLVCGGCEVECGSVLDS